MNEDGEIVIDWIKDALPQPVVEVLSEKEEEEAECCTEEEINETDICEYVEEDEIDNIIDAVFEDDDMDTEAQ